MTDNEKGYMPTGGKELFNLCEFAVQVRALTTKQEEEYRQRKAQKAAQTQA